VCFNKQGATATDADFYRVKVSGVSAKGFEKIEVFGGEELVLEY